MTPSIVAVMGQPSVRDAHRLSENICMAHSSYVRRGRVVHGAVQVVTPTQVVLVSGETFDYDYLVLASGSSTREPVFKSPMVSQTIAGRAAQMAAESERISRARDVLIIGGGPVGVELASEIAMRNPDKLVHIVHNEARLMSGLHPDLGAAAERFFRSRPNCRLYLSQTARELTSSSPRRLFQLGDESTLHVDLAYMCGGVTPNSAVMREHFASSINAAGYVKVNSYLQVPGHERIFAVGDVNDRSDGNLATNAIAQAERTALNLIAIANRRPVDSYTPPPKVSLISFGPMYGVAFLAFFSLTGVFPRGNALVGIIKAFAEAHYFLLFATLGSIIVRMLAWYL